MTTIDFYTHVDDPLRVAAKLAIKAWAQNGKVRVLTPDRAATDALDRLLWCEPATGFVPHCRLSSELAAHTPVIVDEVAEHEGPADVLINLASTPPSFFARFERLAEIVAAGEAQVQAGRDRWRYYRERGYELRVHDLSERNRRADGA